MEAFFQRIFSVPESYTGLRSETAKTVKKLLVLLPIPFIILMGERLIRQDVRGAVLILITLLVSSASFILLKRNYLTGSVIFLCSVITILVTVNATFMQGIHSVALISYPVIIVFSSLIIKRLYLIIFSIISILAIFWLGGGEQLGYYAAAPHSSGHPSDLITTFTILLLGLLITNSLANNLRKTSLHAETALKNTEQSNALLQTTIGQKNELIQEVHVQAKANLHYIRKLLESEDNQDLINLRNRIQALYHVHDTPFISDELESIDFNQYILAYFSDLSSSLSLAADQLQTNFRDISILVDHVNSLGICFHELIKFALSNSPTAPILFESIEQDGLSFRVTTNGLKIPSAPISLFDIAVKQLKAEFSLSDDDRIGTLTLPKTIIEG